MERIICLAVGYICGLFQTGYIYGRLNGIDIRSKGSGNSGTTNALRVLGKKAGLIVYLGDFLKTFIPCAIVRILFREDMAMGYILALYMGFGVILGHNYPFYLGFKGGKGIAAMSALVTVVDLRLMLVCLIFFVGSVAITRYVSVGSLLVAAVFLIWAFLMAGTYGFTPAQWQEYCAESAVISLLAVWRHRANISRLLHGTENKLWGGKKSAA